MSMYGYLILNNLCSYDFKSLVPLLSPHTAPAMVSFQTLMYLSFYQYLTQLISLLETLQLIAILFFKLHKEKL